jgi:hypothetical protein
MLSKGRAVANEGQEDAPIETGAARKAVFIALSVICLRRKAPEMPIGNRLANWLVRPTHWPPIGISPSKATKSC